MVVAALTSRLRATINKVYHAETPVGMAPSRDHGPISNTKTFTLATSSWAIAEKETLIKAIVDWGGCQVASHFMWRSQDVPATNAVFIALEFLRADSFNMRPFETWLSMKR